MTLGLQRLVRFNFLVSGRLLGYDCTASLPVQGSSFHFWIFFLTIMSLV